MSHLRGKECSFKIGIGINSGSGLKFLKKSGSGGIGIEKNSKVPTPVYRDKCVKIWILVASFPYDPAVKGPLEDNRCLQ